MRDGDPLWTWSELQYELEYARARLCLYLDGNGLSQAAFAQLAGVSTSTISAFLLRRTNPSLPVLLAVATAMRIRLWQLLLPLGWE